MEKKTIDYDTLYNLYIIKGLKMTEICKELKSGNETICRELKRHGLSKKTSDYITTHGMSDTRVYKIWQQMKVRCDNPKSIHYSNYGGKGITYDINWEKFEGFWEDMKHGYLDGLTIDRINGNKDYCKENCQWSTYVEQNNNKSDNIATSKSVKELIKITGLSQTAIYRRIRNGWSMEKIINIPKLTVNGKENKNI